MANSAATSKNNINAIVIPLHEDWQYLEASCKLLNDEWPRSHTARMRGLRASCDRMPTSLVLLINVNDQNVVIGHSKLSNMNRYSDACFVECVVIDKEFRHQGWGQFIMKESEKYAKTKNKSILFLSTTDQKLFYSKLGYIECEPISMYGSNNTAQKNISFSSWIPKKNNAEVENINNINVISPPPPPMPQPSNVSTSSKIYMKKEI